MVIQNYALVNSLVTCDIVKIDLLHLSQDVTSRSDLALCNKNGKPLVVYRSSNLR